jgi:nicotinate-nucleotide adenylyltransferase
VLVPAGKAPHKPIERDPGPEERYEMCVLAAAGSDWLDVSREELERPGPSYTVDTLRALRAADPDDELELIIGADQAANLPAWREPSEILRLAGAAVARRHGTGDGEVRSALESLERGDRVTFFDMPRVDVSSSEVRERIAAGRPYRYLVPERVADRIAERGLYREGAA